VVGIVNVFNVDWEDFHGFRREKIHRDPMNGQEGFTPLIATAAWFFGAFSQLVVC
jgi:hypothetical protein